MELHAFPVVFIRNIKFHALHGVMPQERCVGGDFIVSVEVMADVRKAFETDDVEDTVNYALLYDVIKKEMLTPSSLLEHVANRIAKAIFDKFDSAAEVSLEIIKTNPPMGAQCDGAGVRATFTRVSD